MFLQLRGQRVLFASSIVAAILCACGSDDQPAGAVPDGSSPQDSAAVDGAGDATTDDSGDATTQDAVTRDVTSETIVGSDAGDGGDLPPDAIADAPKDAPDVAFPDAGCGTHMPYTNNGDGGVGSCGLGQTYSCQGDQYSIDCRCPDQTCTCSKNGTTVGNLQLFGGCPGCTAANFQQLAFSCGIPY